MPAQSPLRIAFLGLGRMGAPMARRLAADGYDLTVWNRTPGRAGPPVAAGAREAPTPAEAVADRDLVISMLADPPAVENAYLGPDGAAAAIAPGTLVVEMSTIGPAEVRSLREGLPSSTRLLDGPVLGSLPQASAGELKIYLGGAAEDAAACREPLSVLGEPRHVGALGEGAALKLAVNLSFVSATVALGEALDLAERLGLESGTALDALAETPVGVLVERMRSKITAEEAPPTGFALGLAEKDLALAIDEGARPDGVVAAARALLQSGRRAGLDDQDLSMIIRHLRTAPEPPR